MSQLIIEATEILGVSRIQFPTSQDQRGGFVKTFHPLWQGQVGDFSQGEDFYSVSHKNVLRGMHFQESPHQVKKIVSVVSGRILDVVLDLRPDSKTFRQHFCFELSSEKPEAVLVPEGVAHGFYSLSEQSIVMYKQSQKFVSESDAGIRFDSFGFSWPSANPVLSERDLSHPSLDEWCRKEVR